MSNSVGKILWWLNSYKIAEVLFALAQLDIWQALNKRPEKHEVLASAAGLCPQRLEAVLQFLCRLGLVRHNDGLYALPEVLRDSHAMLALESYIHQDLIHASTIIKWLKGAPPSDPLDGNPPQERVELFLRSFETWSDVVALHIWRAGGLFHSRRLLDLGGAAGAHAAALCRLSPVLEATVVDRAFMKPFCEARISALELQERMTFEAFDLRHSETLGTLISAHDSVLLSNVLHLLTPETRDTLGLQLVKHLPRGGKVIVHELFLTSSGDNVANLMAVDWLLFGCDFTMTSLQCASWLRDLGFFRVEERQLPNLPTSVVVAQLA